MKEQRYCTFTYCRKAFVASNDSKQIACDKCVERAWPPHPRREEENQNRPEPHSTRYYYRCLDCLAIFVLVLDGIHPRGVMCECGGRVKLMGQVYRKRLVRLECEVPCDSRCTGARGPSCNCLCGGRNHGSRLVVAVTKDAGGIPTVRGADHNVANEWRSAKAAAYALAEKIAPGIMAHRWVENKSAWWTATQIINAVDGASRRTSHKGRMRMLREAIETGTIP